MQAETLLVALRARGARLRILPGGGLGVAPTAVLSDDVREAIRTNKQELLALLQAVPSADPGAEIAGPWRVTIEENQPATGPIRLADGCTTITDPARCIEKNLIDLERAVAHRNAGRETVFTRLVDEYVEQLGACGCRVRVEAVS